MRRSSWGPACAGSPRRNFIFLLDDSLCLRNNLIVGTTEVKLYNRIAVLRAERNLSRQSVAETIGVNYQTIGYIERGDYFPSLDLAFRLAEVFGVPVEMIFSRQPFEPLSTALNFRQARVNGTSPGFPPEGD